MCRKTLSGVCLLCCGALSYESGYEAAVCSLQVSDNLVGCPSKVLVGAEALPLALPSWGARYAAVLQAYFLETVCYLY